MIASSKFLHKMLKSYFSIGSIHIFVAVMKIILFSIGMLLAVLLPTYSTAGNNVPIHNFDLGHRKPRPIQDFSQRNTLNFDDSLFDIVDDDTDDFERKNLLITKGNYRIDFFKTSNFSNNSFNSIWATRYFFKLHPSLFIFFGALRL